MSQQKPEWAQTLISFDTETTGVNIHTARIVSAAIVLVNSEGEVSERYDWLLNPEVEIPIAAANVHGITTEMAVKNGLNARVGIKQIVLKLQEYSIQGYPLVVYNAPYDLTLLKNECARHDIDFDIELSPVLDPLVIDKQVDRYRRGNRRLETVSAHYGVPLSNAHDAAADAIASALIMQKLSEVHKKHLPDSANELHDSQVLWAKEQAESFAEYMRRVKDPNFVAEGSWPLKA